MSVVVGSAASGAHEPQSDLSAKPSSCDTGSRVGMDHIRWSRPRMRRVTMGDMPNDPVASPQLARTRTVERAGVELAVREYGDSAAENHLVLIHGFPDDQGMWEPVIAHLPPDWHVVTYDVRGAGDSSRPSTVASYRTELLAEDFLAVVEATIPDGAAFHVGAHDWGSIAFWDVIAREPDDPKLQGRIASYTSTSGPSIDHLGSTWTTVSGKRTLLPQAVHSWYVWMFLLPAAPELTWRRLQRPLRPLVTRIDPTIGLLDWGESVARNAVPSVNLYRANVVGTLRHPRPWRTNVPVRLLIAQQDGFVTPRSVRGMSARCRHLTEVEVDGGHWWIRAQPEKFAAEVITQVQAVACPDS